MDWKFQIIILSFTELSSPGAGGWDGPGAGGRGAPGPVICGEVWPRPTGGRLPGVTMG